MIKSATIQCYKSGDKWVCSVKSKDGKKNLGTYRSKKRENAKNRAKKRLQQVEFFKRHGSRIMRHIALREIQQKILES